MTRESSATPSRAGKTATPPVFGITGWKNSGKTTLITRLIEEFTRRGVKVSAIKHAHNAFEFDHKGRDSYKMKEAGAREIAVVSGRRWALFHELRGDDEPSFAQILALLGPCDLVLVEGYKTQGFPKIEVRSTRAAAQEPLSLNDHVIVAVASDSDTNPGGLPRFDIDDVPAIADFIAAYTNLNE